MTIKEIRALTGLSQVKFGNKYHIPPHTIEGWEMGIRKPPEYVLELLERCVIADMEQSEANCKQAEATANPK